MGKLFYKNTILLKYAFLKREVLQRLGKITRPGMSGVMKRLRHILLDIKIILPGFTFVKEDDIFNFMPVKFFKRSTYDVS